MVLIVSLEQSRNGNKWRLVEIYWCCKKHGWRKFRTKTKIVGIFPPAVPRRIQHERKKYDWRDASRCFLHLGTVWLIHSRMFLSFTNDWWFNFLLWSFEKIVLRSVRKTRSSAGNVGRFCMHAHLFWRREERRERYRWSLEEKDVFFLALLRHSNSLPRNPTSHLVFGQSKRAGL